MNVEPAFDRPRAEVSTGLPGFRTWRAVYLLVLAALAFCVVFLTLLPRLLA